MAAAGKKYARMPIKAGGEWKQNGMAGRVK